jgi:hypothetical protein
LGKKTVKKNLISENSGTFQDSIKYRHPTLDGGFVSFCLQVQRNSILVLEGNGGIIGLFQINNQTPVWEMEKKGKRNHIRLKYAYF